ncbi:TetR/AcrR family transcriptional regulator [Actinoplanes sp. NPDC049265]|uniref:TetR/AcrR family transcriptional regulator n=1 Tax=Actinoplanes sp. NPDC049265 TaxID=3363902 RepID=UPI00371B089F
MPGEEKPRAGATRAIAREAVRASISDAALSLFETHGFDAVTMDQVASAVGTSVRSVHRHFPAKEDLVVGDHQHWAGALRDAVADRPAGEPIWESLRRGFRMLLSPPYGDGTNKGQRTLAVVFATPGLRARLFEKHQRFAVLLTPAVRDRLGRRADDLSVSVLVNAAIVCFETTLMQWSTDPDPAGGPALLDRAFSSLRPAGDLERPNPA